MSQSKTVYFDNNATTRVAPQVIDAMLPFLRDFWGNPSSVYSFGKQVARHVEGAREKVAALISADPRDVVFMHTGGSPALFAYSAALASEAVS